MNLRKGFASEKQFEVTARHLAEAMAEVERLRLHVRARQDRIEHLEANVANLQAVVNAAWECRRLFGGRSDAWGTYFTSSPPVLKLWEALDRCPRSGAVQHDGNITMTPSSGQDLKSVAIAAWDVRDVWVQGADVTERMNVLGMALDRCPRPVSVSLVDQDVVQAVEAVASAIEDRDEVYASWKRQFDAMAECVKQTTSRAEKAERESKDAQSRLDALRAARMRAAQERAAWEPIVAAAVRYTAGWDGEIASIRIAIANINATNPALLPGGKGTDEPEYFTCPRCGAHEFGCARGVITCHSDTGCNFQISQSEWETLPESLADSVEVARLRKENAEAHAALRNIGNSPMGELQAQVRSWQAAHEQRVGERQAATAAERETCLRAVFSVLGFTYSDDGVDQLAYLAKAVEDRVRDARRDAARAMRDLPEWAPPVRTHAVTDNGDCTPWCQACGPQCQHGNNSLECKECCKPRKYPR